MFLLDVSSTDYGRKIILTGRKADGTRSVQTKLFDPWLYIQSSENIPKQLEGKIETTNMRPFIGHSFAPHQLLRISRSDFYKLPKTERERLGTRAFESNISPEIQFMSSHPQLSVANWTLSDKDKPPPCLLVMSYDLETTGLDAPTDVIFQVSLVFWRTLDDPHMAHTDSVVICVGDAICPQNAEFSIISVKTERDLLVKLRDIIIRSDPDIMMGYNTAAFDNRFLCIRCMQHHVDMSISATSKPSRFYKKSLSSSAMGSNEIYVWDCPGRIMIDLYLYAKQTFLGLENYSLDYISNHFIGQQKEDVSYGRMLEAFRTKDPSEMGIIASYCYQDSKLCNLLCKKWNTISSILQESRCCSLPNPSSICTTGRQSKLIAFILREIHGKYYLNDFQSIVDMDDGYEGATVIDTKPGLYAKPCDQILCCDFASLYPNLMITYGISPERLDSTNELPDEDVDLYSITSNVTVRLVKRKEGDTEPVFSDILNRLLHERKKIRRAMKSEKDPLSLEIMNCQQLARKVLANSMYGFMGASAGIFKGALMQLAAVVTLCGRNTLQFTKQIAEDEYGCKTIAGDTDSVMVQLPARTHEDPATRMEHCFSLGQKMCDDISARLPGTLELELEAIYWPGLYYRKKHYAAKVWEHHSSPLPHLKIKGLRPVRKDAILFLRDTCQEILNALVMEGNEVKAKRLARDKMLDLKRGLIPLDQLLFSKTLRTFDPSVKSPHVTIARKLRSNGRAPQLGTKVSYLLCQGTRHGDVSESAATVEEVTSGLRKLDMDAYFEKSFIKPVSSLLEPIQPHAEENMREEWRLPPGKKLLVQKKMGDFFKIG